MAFPAADPCYACHDHILSNSLLGYYSTIVEDLEEVAKREFIIGIPPVTVLLVSLSQHQHQHSILSQAS
jgi:hypothetical protein